MEFDIAIERVFPHPMAKVWEAIATREGLGAWLMETDFAPEEGRAFTMWCENERGEVDTYRCHLLSLEPGRRMLWSWVLAASESRGETQGETRVELALEPVEGGTRLRVRHCGDRPEAIVERFRSGWPAKLDALEGVLRTA